MGVTIRTIVTDNVAIALRRLSRGHRRHAVAREPAGHRRPRGRRRLGRAGAHQPRSPPVPCRRRLRPALDGREGLLPLPAGRGARDHAADRPAARPARAGACATASIATITSSSPPDPRRRRVSTPRRPFDARPGVPTLARRGRLGDLGLPRFHDDHPVPVCPGYGGLVPDARSRRRTAPGRTAAARPGEPAPRRRPRHAPALGGRGPGPGVHDPRRTSPVRAARPGAPRRDPPHGRRGRPGRPRATPPIA